MKWDLSREKPPPKKKTSLNGQTEENEEKVDYREIIMVCVKLDESDI